MPRPEPAPDPTVSPFLLKWFRRYVRRYLRKHFHRVLLLRTPLPEAGGAEPLVFYMNHPSWWDPLVALFLSGTYFPDRDHFGPIDARALERYGILRKLGFFGVDLERPRGAKAFLDNAQAVLGRSDAALWLTPQGEFADVRERPPKFKPGLAHLAARLDAGRAVPVAIEYAFWEERQPELFAAFGQPLDLSCAGDAESWTAQLEAELGGTQDRLADAVRARQVESFEPVLTGKSGVGGVYDLWRRGVARLRGRRFDPSHAAIRDRSSPS